jgi:cysteinyl-tRNA synthetase
MSISIYNTLHNKKEEFKSLENKKVKMYVCGPTVYNFIHVGNARPLVFFEVVRRFLKYQGYQVTFASNYTDVDDKIINRAKEEKCSWTDITKKYILEYEKDRELLKVTKPDFAPKVSDYIEPIKKLIQKLIANKKAYVVSDGEVFYSVRSFEDYGKLSGKKIDDLQAGARVNPRELKKDPLDFSLWKPKKEANEPSWESPWGEGRPGWHIECSAMVLGSFKTDSIDIHGGGMDLMHPHHENEIAQSEGATGKIFSHYWMHNNMLTVDSEKMSKSIGNIFLTRKFIESYGAETLKFLLLSGHYRSTIDFSEKNIKDTQVALHRIYSCLNKCQKILATTPNAQLKNFAEEEKIKSFAATFKNKWEESMSDDFNTAGALGFVFEYVRHVNALIDKKNFVLDTNSKQEIEKFVSDIKNLASVFNVLGENPEQFISDFKAKYLTQNSLSQDFIDSKINDRNEARKNKDFKKADEIRDELKSKGIVLRDAQNLTEWDVEFN